MIIIFAGMIGRNGVGGAAWENMQYLAGLLELGHDVYYLEDCGPSSWVYHWENEALTDDPAYPAAYVEHCLHLIDMQDRWIYRAGERSLGLGIDDFKQLCGRADCMIIGALPLKLWRPEYDLPAIRVYIDVDPGFTQMRLANGDALLARTLDRCERLFTIGRGIGGPGSPIPSAGYRWHETRPLVSLKHWPVAPADDDSLHFTTVMRWRGYGDVVYEGVEYGQKDREFERFRLLPAHTTQAFRLALMGTDPLPLQASGWDVVPGWVPSTTPESYRDFIQGSRAEFSVAKHGYVATGSGWFSDRSVCYLASGKPVLVQDTGIDTWLPVGEGILTFRSLDQAISGIDEINRHYNRHCRTARDLVERHFDSGIVLTNLLERALN